MKFTDSIFAVFAPLSRKNSTTLVNVKALCTNTFQNCANDIQLLGNDLVDIALVNYSQIDDKKSTNKTIPENKNSSNTSEHNDVNFSDSKSYLKQNKLHLLSIHRLDNEKALLEQLFKNASNTFSTRGDTSKDTNNNTNSKRNDHKDQHQSLATIANAYTAWGKDCFGQFKGSFSSIIWDEQSQVVHAAIDAFSGRSLFYLEHQGVFYVGSDAKLLAQVSGVNLTVNKMALSQWLAGRPDPNCSMFNEIKMLPGGHSFSYDLSDTNDAATNTVSLTKFWDISPEFTLRYNSLDQYKDHFLSLLTNSVSDRLVCNESGHANVFCQMSGGMDSTSVTALAKQLLNQQALPLHTLSHRYKNTQSCDESDNINDMIEKLDLQHQHYIELDQFQQSSFAQLYPTAFDNPGIVLSPKYHQELQLMQQLGTQVLLTGNGGDETCWGHSDTYKTRLYKGELAVIPEVIKASKTLNEPVVRSLYSLFMPAFLKNLVNIARNKPTNAAETPSWLTEEAKDWVNEGNALFVNPFSEFFDPAKHARYQGLKTTSTYNSMRSYQRVANQYGIDVRHPFFDTEVVEFSFAIPEKLLIQDIYPKWLLRQTMTPYLPDSVCWNKQKVVFDHHFANLVRSNKNELRKLLAHEGLQDIGLLDNNVLLQQFDAVVDNPNGQLHVDMLYAILTQLWFQTHCL